MSTGDQSQYVRAKLAERGSNAQAKFMMDGFDRWAESTAPAREGQMEKIPAESQMASYGGAMTVSKAKQKLLKLEGMHELEGGVDVIPQAVKDAANEAKKMIQVWRGVSARIDSFLEELQDQVIDDPKSSASLVNFAKTLQGWFNQIKFLKDILDGAAKLAESVGLGKKRKHSVKLRGGASLSWSDLAGYAKQITSLYMWLKTNAGNMKKILAMKSLQPEGQQILDVVNPILSAIGMGRPSGGRSASDCCQCDDMKGGNMSMDEFVRLTTRPTYREKVDYYEPGIKTGGFMDEMTRMLTNPGYAQKTTHSGIKRPMGGRSRAARKVAIMEGPSYGGAAPLYMAPATKYSPEEEEKIARAKMEGYRGSQDVNSPYLHQIRAANGGASCGGRKPSARGAIVKKVMREMGLSLPQASKYVKENGLY
jgi:hypothetical protein